MRDLLKSFLFEHHVLVNDYGTEEPHPLEAMISLAEIYHVKITEGHALAHRGMLRFLGNELGDRVSGTFYRGFPESVKRLPKGALLLDQILHYVDTYGLGNFFEAGHSLFEEEITRTALDEDCRIVKVRVLSEEKATAYLLQLVDECMKGSRPLSDRTYEVIRTVIGDYGYEVKAAASKHTVVRLLCDTKDLSLLRFLMLSDVIKLLEVVNCKRFEDRDSRAVTMLRLQRASLRRLNLANADRRFLTAVIDELFRLGRINVQECFEKKAVWCGFLHHIHYLPKCDEAKEFVSLMRGRENRSVYSAFERAIGEGDVCKAADLLIRKKGEGAFLRNLNYLVSRSKSESDVTYLLSKITGKSPLLLVQMLLRYANYRGASARTFRFPKNSLLVTYTESEEDQAHRRSVLSELQRSQVEAFLRKKLRETLAGRLGRVYVDEAMHRIALPLSEATSEGGFGVLPKGSHIPLERGKKIRAFTYWEGVNDVDLSIIGIKESGERVEFSWRTMGGLQSDAVAYSGDQTAGFHGGSEFFDVDPSGFFKKYGDVRYLIFANNVYSGTPFSECTCRAGYMLRNRKDSGAIFEPKTVESSFRIDCASTSAYLFGIDMAKSEFVWLNVAKDGSSRIAALQQIEYMTDYFGLTETMNLGLFFEMMATELVTDPAEADLVVSDRELPLRAGARQIHSYDFGQINALLG